MTTTTALVCFAVVLSAAATLSAAAAGDAALDSACTTCSGCGNGRCDYPAEDCRSCAADCGVCPPCERLCGNQLCEATDGETSCNCPEDCGVCCIDGTCAEDRGETFENCAPDCAATVRGVVVDAVTLAPVNDATVTCTSVDHTLGPLLTGVDTNVFEFTNVPAGVYSCVGQDVAMAYAPTSVSVAASAGAVVDATIALPRKFCSIVGLTYDNVTDLPLEEADVQCFSAEAVPTPPPGEPLPPAQGPRCSSANGMYFFVNVLPITGEYVCEGNKLGYAPGECTTRCNVGRNHECDIPMRPLPALVHGDVADATNELPLAATVLCTYANGNADVRQSDPLRTGPEGFDGYFTFDRTVPPGVVTCTAAAPSYEPQSQTFEVFRGDDRYIQFRLVPRPSSIFGCITDATSAQPIMGANARSICTLDRGDGSTPEDFVGLSNEFCDYEIHSLDPGSYSCICSAELYESSLPVAIDLPPGVARRHDCELFPAPATLLGTVRSTDAGRPDIPDADVSCRLANATVVDRVTDFSGDWVIGRVTAFGSTQCTCAAVGFASDVRSGIAERGEDTRIDCDLTPNALRVRVIDGDNLGQVINGANVTFTPSSTGGCQDIPDGVTNGAGEVLRRPICADTWSVEASFPGYESSGLIPVATIDGEEVLLIIELKLIRRDFLVYLYDRNIGVTQHVPDGLVRFSNPPFQAGQSEDFSCTTPADIPPPVAPDVPGECLVRLIVPRTYGLQLTAPGYANIQTTLPLQDFGANNITRLEFAMVGISGRIVITLEDLEGNALSEVGVQLFDECEQPCVPETFPIQVTGPPDFDEGSVTFSNVPIVNADDAASAAQPRYCATVGYQGTLVPDGCTPVGSDTACADVFLPSVPGRIRLACETNPFGTLRGLVENQEGNPIGTLDAPERFPTCTFSGVDLEGNPFEHNETAVSFIGESNQYGWLECPVGVDVNIECTAIDHSVNSVTARCVPGAIRDAPTIRLVSKLQTVIYQLQFESGGELFPPAGGQCLIYPAGAATSDEECETVASSGTQPVGRVSNTNVVPLEFPEAVALQPLCLKCIIRFGLPARYLNCDSPNTGIQQVCSPAANNFDVVNFSEEVLSAGRRDDEGEPQLVIGGDQ